MVSPAAARRRAWRFGRLAETACAWHLRLRGYGILARGFRSPLGEIDIIARRGHVLAIIEVKARADFTAAAEAVSPRQRRRIANAALLFLRGRPGEAALDLRFDVMLVSPWRWPRHLADAWRPEA